MSRVEGKGGGQVLGAWGKAAGVAGAFAVSLVSAADPCPECARGDALIAKYSLEALRTIDLATIPTGDPMTADDYARIIALREQNPALARVGALDDDQVVLVAAALCHATFGPCNVNAVNALRCLADRCTADLPKPKDLLDRPRDCNAYGIHRRSTRYGIGFDWGNGWQRSKYPSDGGAWSLGIEGRYRITPHFGAVARVDRAAGRDEATDADHNGRDDVSTGEITRISALAGPSIVLDNTRYEDSTRFAELDLLGGYLATRSQVGEAGPAAGFDLSYQLSVMRFGVRFVQGFGDASNAALVLAHMGIVDGAEPPYDSDTDCGSTRSPRSTHLSLAMDFPFAGWGLSSELGYMVPSIGVETAWHVVRRFDLIAHADLLIYPGFQRDRTLHQAVLAGGRFNFHRSDDFWWHVIAMAGYTHGVGFTPTDVGSGPVADVAIGWGGGGYDGSGFLRLHYRNGISGDNSDYRAIFVSGGFELYLDPSGW